MHDLFVPYVCMYVCMYAYKGDKGALKTELLRIALQSVCTGPIRCWHTPTSDKGHRVLLTARDNETALKFLRDAKLNGIRKC